MIKSGTINYVDTQINLRFQKEEEKQYLILSDIVHEEWGKNVNLINHFM